MGVGVTVAVAAGVALAVAEARLMAEICMHLLGVRVPRIPIGDNLVQIKAMRLANVKIFGSQCLASNQSSICATDRQIKTWSICMHVCILSQRNHNFTEQIRR